MRVMSALIRCAETLRTLQGWRRLAAAAAGGALSVLALPPFYVLPILLVTVPALLLLLEGAGRTRTAFVVGWAFGFGYFVAGLYWIANALLIDAASFGWMIPFATAGLGSVLAVYIGGSTALLVRLGLTGLPRVLAFAALWTLMEILRGVLLTGFPWNPVGSVWAGVAPVMQAAAVVGVFGLSLGTMLVAALPVLGRRALGVGMLGLAVVAGAGWFRIPDGAAPVADGVRLRLVQPAIPQAMKWAEGAREANLGRYLSLSQLPGHGVAPTHILWGETAVPYAMDGVSDAALRRLLAAPLQVHAGSGARADGTPARGVLVGAIRRSPPGEEPFRIWNSLIALDASGAVTGQFDKAHLVPFGEYVPLRSALPLDAVAGGGLDYTAGPGPRTLDIPGLPPVGPLICYEVIFPGAVVDRDRRPEWLLNLTNDGWYGVSTGPYQHLETAVLRAVEEGLPVVRVANTGVSAVVDAYGRTTASIGLEQSGFVDADLPRPVAPTVFSYTGVWGPLGLAVALLLGAIGLGRLRRR